MEITHYIVQIDRGNGNVCRCLIILFDFFDGCFCTLFEDGCIDKIYRQLNIGTCVLQRRTFHWTIRSSIKKWLIKLFYRLRTGAEQCWPWVHRRFTSPGAESSCTSGQRYGWRRKWRMSNFSASPRICRLFNRVLSFPLLLFKITCFSDLRRIRGETCARDVICRLHFSGPMPFPSSPSACRRALAPCCACMVSQRRLGCRSSGVSGCLSASTVSTDCQNGNQ